MATYNPSDLLKPAHSQAFGNGSRFTGKATTTAALAANDVVNLALVPAGTIVDRVVVKNPDLDTGSNLVFKLGFAPADGSSAPSTMSSPDAAVAAAGQTTWQAAATTTYEIFPPYRVDVDCYLQAVIGTGGATNTGTIYAKVEGECQGAK